MKNLLSAICACLVIAPAGVAAEEQQAAVQESNFLDRQIEKLPHDGRDLPWLVGGFNLWSGIASGLVIGAAIESAHGLSPVGGLGGQIGEEDDVVRFGDDVYKLIPGAGYITSLVAKDYRGFAYMGVHNIVSSGIMQTLKDEVGQRRPGNQSSTSFPSGHTNTAFVGAAFMQQRYGARWGIPSYISAFLVGWSRVYGNKHYVNDIIGGASVGMMSAWAIVPPYDAERQARWRDLERDRNFRYEWEMTLNDVDRNQVQAPAETGDTFRSPLDKEFDEPWANSHVAFEYSLDRRRSIHGRFSPWEIRSFGQFSSPTTFAGTLFPADQELRVAHLMWTYEAQYRQILLDTERFVLRGGLGVSGQYTEEEIFVVDESRPEGRGLSARSDARAWYGVAHVDAELKLFWKLHLGAEADIGLASDNSYLDWSTRLKARLNPKWDVSLGWREFETDLKDNALRNDFKRSGLALNLGYSF